MSKAPRHFLDLLDMPTGELRAILDASVAMKKRRKEGATPTSRSKARRWR